MSEKTTEELRKLGNEKFRNQNYGGALMCYTQAIDKEPNNYALYYNRSVTLVKMNAIEEAKDDLLKSIDINDEYIPSLCQLAFLYLYEGDTPSSLETYVKVVKINERLPNQLDRFKAQLKESIRLTEGRCKQQEYSQNFIDSIITPDIRSIIDSYPNLPTHMIESGIPPVAFGNVSIGQMSNRSAVVASAVPIRVRRNTNNDNNNEIVGGGININAETAAEDIGNAITRALSATGFTGIANNIRAATNANTTTNTNVGATNIAQIHRDAVATALRRTEELRRERNAAAAPAPAAAAAPAPIPVPVPAPVEAAAVSSPAVPESAPENASSESSSAPTSSETNNESTASTAPRVTTSVFTTSTNNGNDFASQLANTISAQLGNVVSNHLGQNLNPSTIEAITSNLSSGVGSLAREVLNGFSSNSSTTGDATTSTTSTTSTTNAPLDANLDLDID